MRRITNILLLLFLSLIVLGALLPQPFAMPVQQAQKQDYHQHSFWYYPWGKSITHKGVDIFAKEGTQVHASTTGLVLYAGDNGIGGKVVLVLGAKWRLHYFAHLKRIHSKALSWVNTNTPIGEVGTTGNALGKPAHLHYAIVTLIPYPWQYDHQAPQGWFKLFFINPIPLLNQQFKSS